MQIIKLNWLYKYILIFLLLGCATQTEHKHVSVKMELTYHFYTDIDDFQSAIDRDWIGAAFPTTKEVFVYMGENNKEVLGHEQWHHLHWLFPDKFTDPDVDGGTLK